MSLYPGTIDTLPTGTLSTDSTGASDHHAHNHNNANSAIIAIQETLGVNPQGEAAYTVGGRIALVEAGLADVLETLETLGGAAVVTDAYTTGTHTWTKATGAKQVDVILVGPGGPGGGGGTAGAASSAGGGGGGGAGAIVVWSFRADELSSSVTVTIPASVATAGASTNDAAATAGTQPSAATFGGYMTAKAGRAATAAGGAGALQASCNLPGRGVAVTQAPGGAAGSSANVGATPSDWSNLGVPTGGGGGGAKHNSGTHYAGGAGGKWQTATTVFPAHAAATAGTAGGGHGAAGATAGLVGLGGAGGGGNNAGGGGNGGAGGFPGGGGGGGGAALNGFSGGSGGAGGAGLCIVIQRL